MVKKKKTRSSRVDLLRIADFIILNTMVFQEVLSGQKPRKGEKPVRSLRAITTNLQPELTTEWRDIEVGINYKPIFRLASEVLGAFPTGPHTEAVLSQLRDLALSIVSSGVHLRHDLMGRIYHKLLLRTTGPYYATYYTSIPAATLLSDLLVKTNGTNWEFTNPELLKEFRIIDPACGSGTLLSSTYAAMTDRFVLEHHSSIDELAEIHLKLLEEVIYGFDVLDYAAHLTLTTLAMHNPKSRFLRSNIYTLPNGVASDEMTHLGSLDYLDPQTVLQVKPWGHSPTEGEVVAEEQLEIPLKDDSFDCVVMNPPFARSAKPNLKFGYATPEIQGRMSKRLRDLTHLLNMEGIGRAGLGAHFIVLANKLLKKGGRVGIVIPRHILSGVSWSKVREILYKDYEIEYIISNFDPTHKGRGDKGWCWSENTDLGEVLLVARKTDSSLESRKCLLVNVRSRPANQVESLLLSQQIRRERDNLAGNLMQNSWAELTLDKRLAGYTYWVEQNRLKRNWHLACLFSHPGLVQFSINLAAMDGLVPLGQLLVSDGYDIKGVKTHFSQAKSVTPYPILWGHQKAMDQMCLDDSFVGYGVPKKGKKSEAIHKKYTSDLLIAERPHTNNDCLLALETARPVLATAFWEIKLNDPRFRPLILLWMNSTFGFLLGLSAGANSQGPIFKIKQEHLPEILVPAADEKLMGEAKTFYDSAKKRNFKPFPEEFSLAAQQQGVRWEIDSFFRRALGISADMSAIYGMLKAEPMLAWPMTKRPRAGLVREAYPLSIGSARQS